MLIHTGPISGLATYGPWVATAGYDNRVILWDAASKTALAQGTHDHLVNNCSFSSDGNWLVSASSDYSARVWSVPTMRLEAVLPGHGDDVDMAVFSPDDTLIATCALDKLVRVFDRRGKCLVEFHGHCGNVLALAWAADGKHLISSSVDGTIRKWSLEDKKLAVCTDLKVRTDSVEISSSGLIFAGDDRGRIVRIDGEEVLYVNAHKAGIKKVVLDDRLQQLVCLSYDGYLSVWDIRGVVPLEMSRSEVPHVVWARGAALLDDGRVVSGTFGTTFAVFDPKNFRWDTLGVAAGRALNAVLIESGTTYCVGDSGEVFANGQKIASLGSLCNFLVASAGLLMAGGQLGKIFDAESTEVLFHHHSPLNCAVSFLHKNSPAIAVGTYTGEILIFRIENKNLALIKTIKAFENAVKSLCFSNGILFSVCADTTIAWHGAESFSLVALVQHAHQKIINDCCVVDKLSFATVSRDRTLKIWRGEKSETYASPHLNSIKCLCINEDRTQIITGSYGGTLAIFDLVRKTWKICERPTMSGISDLAWDWDHHHFVASSYDGNLYAVAT